uniref:Uncharacterized protein n=1 Tax=Ascaris lumbricoides TaxID=6252 RepID=A0A9J2P797_ASCLU
METEQRHSQTDSTSSSCATAPWGPLPHVMMHSSALLSAFAREMFVQAVQNINTAFSRQVLPAANWKHRTKVPGNAILGSRLIAACSRHRHKYLSACVATSSIVQQKADDIFNETNTFARLRSQLENRQNASANKLSVSQSQSNTAAMLSSDGVQKEALNLTLKSGEMVIVHLSESGSNTVVNNGTAVNVISKGGWSASHKL